MGRRAANEVPGHHPAACGRANRRRLYAWIAERSPQAAAGWYDGLAHAINSLTDMPQRCGLAPENDAFEEEIRQLLYGPRGRAYRALFTVKDDAVHILHVRHYAAGPLEAEGIEDE